MNKELFIGYTFVGSGLEYDEAYEYTVTHDDTYIEEINPGVYQIKEIDYNILSMQEKENRIKMYRDQLLKESDKYALVDTFSLLTQENQEKLIEYRTLLRNFEYTKGYPWNGNINNPVIPWPKKPEFMVIK